MSKGVWIFAYIALGIALAIFIVPFLATHLFGVPIGFRGSADPIALFQSILLFITLFLAPLYAYLRNSDFSKTKTGQNILNGLWKTILIAIILMVGTVFLIASKI